MLLQIMYAYKQEVHVLRIDPIQLFSGVIYLIVMDEIMLIANYSYWLLMMLCYGYLMISYQCKLAVASMSSPVSSEGKFFRRGAKPQKRPKIRQLWHHLAVAHKLFLYWDLLVKFSREKLTRKCRYKLDRISQRALASNSLELISSTVYC